MYDTHGNQLLGHLNTDRPHYVKLQGSYDLPWGTGVGLNWYARSGALFSTGVSYQGYASIWYKGRGDLGRSPLEQQLDLLVQHDIKIGSKTRANVSLNVTNLLDNDVATSIFTTQFRDTFTFTPVESFFSGWDPVANAQVNLSKRPDPRFYGATTPTTDAYNSAINPLKNGVLARRDVRVGVRFSF